SSPPGTAAATRGRWRSARTGSATAWSPRRRSASSRRPPLLRNSRGSRTVSCGKTHRNRGQRRNAMAVEVKIPTILRTYTGGARTVSADGGTLVELIDDLDARHPGLKERLVDGEALRRFVNVYVNDEDVRFTGG